MKRIVVVVGLLLCTTGGLQSQCVSVGRVDSVAVGGSDITLSTLGAVVQVRPITSDLIRVRAVRGHSFGPDRSAAVVKHDWPPVRWSSLETPKAVWLRTNEIDVEIAKDPLRITFFDKLGNVINADDSVAGMRWEGASVRITKVLPAREAYYGFGEKAGRLNKKSAAMTMWNSDIPGYAADTDPLYQSIPFFYGIRNGAAYGIFFDNSFWSSFDMGKESPNRFSFGADSGEVNYYFFYGPSPRTVLTRFTELVGRMSLPPLWSLGYQQCRWSYAPERRVREIARTFREKKIPADVIYLDIDYMDGYRVFTWDKEKFPHPASLIKDLAAEGFKVAVIIDPGIKVDPSYEVYRSGLAGDCFLKRPDGHIYVGKVWPGECAFPDFSSAATRRWWGRQFAGLVAVGVRGWWTDMNEPSVFDVPGHTVALDVIHHDDGYRTTHARNHNLYGLRMTEATYEGVRALRPDERPFILTRASYAGGQRYAAAWTGDNVASWEHLRMAVPMCLNLSISGQPFVGSDIGGFIGSPDGELYARWLQLGVFTPLMRTHTVINSADQEPWSFGPAFERINRKSIELRYQLMPYLYSSMQEASISGIPPMRPLVFDFPGDPRVEDEETEFLFGDNMLVAPVLQPGARKRSVYLPSGAWRDFWTGNLLEGGKEIQVSAPMDTIPIFVRAGSVIPLQPTIQFVNGTPFRQLILQVYPGNGDAGFLYEDDGTSFAYEHGAYLRRSFSSSAERGLIAISLAAKEGKYRPPDRMLEVRFLGVESEPTVVTANGRHLPHLTGESIPPGQEGWTYDRRSRRIVARVRDNPDGLSLSAEGRY